MKNFEEWGYSSNPNVDEETYLAAFLATWLSGQALSDSSSSIHLETFWVASGVAQGKMYSLVVPSSWTYNRLREFKATKGKVPRSFGP